MNKNIKAIDSETYHVNTLKLHGEVRKAEIDTLAWTTDKGEERETQKIIIKVDDDNEDRIVLFDKDVSHMNKYVKGTEGTFILRCDMTKAKDFGSTYEVKLTVIDFIAD